MVSNTSSTYPQAYYCPITLQIMTDPVICSDGHTYDRASIMRWFEDHNTSPLTGLELNNLNLIPNIVLRNLIQESFSQTSTTSNTTSNTTTSNTSNPYIINRRRRSVPFRSRFIEQNIIDSNNSTNKVIINFLNY